MQTASPTLLVTGGAGFIGAHLVHLLVQAKGARVVNLDKLTYAGNPASLADLDQHPHHHFVQGDICDADLLKALFAKHKPDAVIHLAAESHVDRAIDAPAAFIQTNLVGTYTLLEAARQYWQTLPEPERAHFRFLHVSTDEVHGSLAPGAPPFHADSPYAPRSPYSASKAGADHLVRAWFHTYGLPIQICTCSNNYGPRQYPEKFIPLVILKCLQNKPIPIYGSGQQVRDWIHVTDHCRALWQVLTESPPGETWHIGGGHEICNLDLATAICGQLDVLHPGIRPYRDLLTHVADRPGHDFRYAMDTRKLRHAFNWQPEISLEAGLEQTLRWYLEHADWWQALFTQSDNPLARKGLT